MNIDSVDRGCPRLRCCAVLVTRVLCGVSSDLVCMGQRELRHDQHTVLWWAVHIQSAGAAKPNAKTQGVGSVHEYGI